MTEFAIPLVTEQSDSQPAEVAGCVWLPQAGRTDRGLTAMAVAGVTALSALGMGPQLHGPTAACLGRRSRSMGGHPVARVPGPVCVGPPPGPPGPRGAGAGRPPGSPTQRTEGGAQPAREAVRPPARQPLPRKGGHHDSHTTPPRGGRDKRNPPASINITPVRVADL